MTSKIWKFGMEANRLWRSDASAVSQRWLPKSDALDAFRTISGCPHYQRTPLRSLPGAARSAGVQAVLYKDESERFGLDSFKSLGGSYAVAMLLKERVAARLGSPISVTDLLKGNYRAQTLEITATCASDGNHGRSVAAGARIFGCKCAIFLHEGVSPQRETAIRDEGAEIIRTVGNYDESVRQARAAAAANGWDIVSDTVEDDATGDFTIPSRVMQGYRVLSFECQRQLADLAFKQVSHIFVQAGVGGLAASVVAHFLQMTDLNTPPKFIVVEPERADCLFQSARYAALSPASGDLDTIMAGLACGQASRAAWPILSTGAQFFMTITDDAAQETMRILAAKGFSDNAIVAGESAVAGLAGLLALSQDSHAYDRAGLTRDSIVLVIGTEGATDQENYQEIVGRSPSAVRRQDER